MPHCAVTDVKGDDGSPKRAAARLRLRGDESSDEARDAISQLNGSELVPGR